MGRPIKKNADYFPHDKGMRNGRKVQAVRKKFGLKGYAIYFMFMELLTDCDGFEIQIDEVEMELIAGDFGIDSEELNDIINYFVKLGILQHDDGKYSSSQLTEALSPLIEKRIKDTNYRRGKLRKGAKNGVNATENPEETPNNGVNAAENTQSKVEESKVKKSKVNTTTKSSSAEAGGEIVPLSNGDFEKMGFEGKVVYFYSRNYPMFPVDIKNAKSVRFKIMDILSNLKRSRGNPNLSVSENEIYGEFERMMTSLPNWMRKEGRQALRYIDKEFSNVYPSTIQAGVSGKADSPAVLDYNFSDLKG